MYANTLLCGLPETKILAPRAKPPRWPSGEPPALRVADLASIPAFAEDLFPVPVITMSQKLVLHWLHCQASSVIGSVLELVGPVPGYRDRMRQKV